MKKFSGLVALVSNLFVLNDGASAFSAPSFVKVSARRTLSPTTALAYDLVPEPEGGEIVPRLVPLEDGVESEIKMKNMGINSEMSEESGGSVYNFWMRTGAPGVNIKKNWTTISKDAAKNAQFPGFRKGQIPPYAQPKMVSFAMQEAIVDACESTAKLYGLKAMAGDEGEVDVKEDIKAICMGYNPAKKAVDVPFTATFSAVYDAAAIANEVFEEAEVIDVVAEES